LKIKKRLDVLLFEQGICKSREEAKFFIMSGKVYVNGQKSDKPGEFYDKNIAKIEITGKKNPYVSRGGLKIEKALKKFNINLKDKIVMDVGASTGGFTDCMLQNGAQKIFAIDVGYGQLAWSLRNDVRVVNLERTNIRYIDSEKIDSKVDFFTIDVSFISLRLVLPVIKLFLHENSEGVCLVKPQFEAGKEKVGKKGVVKSPEVHAEVLDNILNYTVNLGFYIKNLDYSPIKGPEGNIEYLLNLSLNFNDNRSFDINNLVKNSHDNLNSR